MITALNTEENKATLNSLTGLSINSIVIDLNNLKILLFHQVVNHGQLAIPPFDFELKSTNLEQILKRRIVSRILLRV